VDLPSSSWGSGKDWRVWDGAQVSDLVAAGAALQSELLAVPPVPWRDPVRDQLVREALLTLSSDWAFMVTKDSAADYARRRAKVHGERFAELAGLVRRGHGGAERAAEMRAEDGLFGRLDARGLWDGGRG
jgi:1,4-alpha-glucan branching enzyme